MKLVIKLDEDLLTDTDSLTKCATAVLSLVQDRHRIVIVHGSMQTTEEARVSSVNDSGSLPETSDPALTIVAGGINKMLVDRFSSNGLNTIGICGADLRMFRVRASHHHSDGSQGAALDIVGLSCYWPDALCNLGLVPIVASVGRNGGEQFRVADGDCLACEFASRWTANALIFLTASGGIRAAGGDVIRWLIVDNLDESLTHRFCDQRVISRLLACRRALKLGVNRIRILPATHVQELALFYTSRIDVGTEVCISLADASPCSGAKNAITNVS